MHVSLLFHGSLLYTLSYPELLRANCISSFCIGALSDLYVLFLKAYNPFYNSVSNHSLVLPLHIPISKFINCTEVKANKFDTEIYYRLSHKYCCISRISRLIFINIYFEIH